MALELTPPRRLGMLSMPPSNGSLRVARCHDGKAVDFVHGSRGPAVHLMQQSDLRVDIPELDIQHLNQVVFVVDPDQTVCRAIQTLSGTMNLGYQGFASGQDFLGAYRPELTGCVVMELRIPGVSGLQIQDHLLSACSLMPVIFLTGYATVSMAVRAMQAGAVTVLEKPFREFEMWDAIQAAVQLNRHRLAVEARNRRDRHLLEQLTDKERNVLMLLSEGQSKKAIAGQLKICVRTVEVRRSQIMKKLGAANTADLVRFAMVAEEQEPAFHE